MENSAAATISNVDGIPIVDIRDIEGEAEGCIIYSTVHSYKGMESSAVILCGLSDITSHEQKSLVYVGMSRARSHLVLLVHNKIKKLIPKLTKMKLTDGWAN